MLIFYKQDRQTDRKTDKTHYVFVQAHVGSAEGFGVLFAF